MGWVLSPELCCFAGSWAFALLFLVVLAKHRVDSSDLGQAEFSVMGWPGDP